MKTFWLRDERRNPIACVAVSEPAGGKVAWAIAIHRPTDKFNKTMGRTWAEGRLRTFLKGRKTMANKKWFIDGFVGEVSQDEAKVAILCQLVNGKLIPARVREAAFKMLAQRRAQPPESDQNGTCT